MSWRAKIDRSLERFILQEQKEPTEIMLTKILANPVAVEQNINVKDLKEYNNLLVSVHEFIFLPVDEEGNELEVIVDKDLSFNNELIELFSGYSISIYIK